LLELLSMELTSKLQTVKKLVKNSARAEVFSSWIP
jgi:hypothetical protein